MHFLILLWQNFLADELNKGYIVFCMPKTSCTFIYSEDKHCCKVGVLNLYGRHILELYVKEVLTHFIH